VGTYYVDREIGTGIAQQVIIGWESLAAATIMFVVVTFVANLLPETLSFWISLPLLGLLVALTHYIAIWVLQREVAVHFRALAKALLARDRAALKKLMQSGLQSSS
jgi:hypothetical protein